MSLKKLMLAGLLSISFGVYAQNVSPMLQELTDSAVRIGKLPNGLTYYIRHNENPKGQADFHIAQKVGAVQENEDQNGLAHFLEHMCFNGTKNFPDKQLLTWLESKGVKFGMNLNAHTGTDQTVYDIMNVPVANREVVDSCLLILHDWADALTLADEEIEKERGVIHEEWRIGNNAISRVLDRHAPELYPNTKYATHNVIGDIDIIDNFKPQVLRDYYEKWYRPDLQGIIVVGDINVDSVEMKIKDLFSPIKMPENPAEFTYETVGDNEAPIVISDKDAEMPYNMIMVAQKFDKLPRENRNTMVGLISDYVDFVITYVLNNRLIEITLSNDAPFSGAGVSIDSYLYANTKGALLFQGIVNDKGSDAALKAILTELKRFKEYGCTAAEYDRARAEYISQLEKQYKNFGSAKNGYFAQIYINNFLESTPITAVDFEYQTMGNLVASLPVEMINEEVKALITGKNLVAISFCPDKEGVEMPSVDSLKAVFAEVDAATVEPYEDTTVSEPLLAESPECGSIVEENDNAPLGYTQLLLSNGVKVVLKKTDHKENEVLFKAVSEGGASLYDAADYANALLAADILSSTGLGQFSYTDLMKMMSGKQVTVSPNIGDYKETMTGSASINDLETMMQLIYLNFTQPREDRAAFENIKSMSLSQIENVEHDPQYVFQDSLVRKLFAHHPKAMIQSTEMFEKVNYDRALQIYKERFGNAADFTFFFVGNFDVDTMKDYVKRYVASLPSSSLREESKNDGKSIMAGKGRSEFVLKSENNMAMLAMIWSKKVPYTLDNIVKTSIAGQLMANELLNSVREDEGAAYSPYSVGSIEQSYEDVAVVQTAFALNPDKSKTSEQTTINCFEKLANGIPETELQKMKEYMLKKYEENIVDNSYWLSALERYVVDGIDEYTDYKEMINSLTVEDMQNYIHDIVTEGNRFELLMLPN